ncbi:hypothetical protein CK203_044350 [Vitis vinifera]|uniref:Uncharacterized protein n=1 Tax=Vitis vinifera TaxID=29760 RepID=A0A438H7X4_VITVI|nr:hypothetical protein CK203_044350 [Vitis vinifera]
MYVMISNSDQHLYKSTSGTTLVGGYGFGYGVPFYAGGVGLHFHFFAPGPSVAIGVGGGFEVLVLFLFLGAVAAVIRRFAGSKDEDDDYY